MDRQLFKQVPGLDRRLLYKGRTLWDPTKPDRSGNLLKVLQGRLQNNSKLLAEKKQELGFFCLVSSVSLWPESLPRMQVQSSNLRPPSMHGKHKQIWAALGKGGHGAIEKKNLRRYDADDMVFSNRKSTQRRVVVQPDVAHYMTVCEPSRACVFPTRGTSDMVLLWVRTTSNNA